MPIDIDHLSFEELLELNRRVVARLKALEPMRVQAEMMRFRPGQRVRFEHQGRRLFGTLVKHNRKTVTVITDQGERWNVSPHLLSPVKGAGASTTPSVGKKKKRIRSPGSGQ